MSDISPITKQTQAPLFEMTVEGLTANDWRNVACALWNLLDDIDTLSDAMTPAQTPYYRAVMAYAVKRHEHLASDGYRLTRPPEEHTAQREPASALQI